MIQDSSNVIEWLTNTATRAPEGIAISDGDTQYCYREYDQLTNGAAHDLVREGVNPGDRVGIFIGKCAAYYLAVYAILKAGACYVPLSLDDPPEILKAKINSVGITTVIIPDASGHGNLSTLSVSLYEMQSATATARGPACRRSGRSKAYVCYTSGSTGTPKPVVINDGALQSFFDGIREHIPTSSTDRFANTAPSYFDIANYDIFSAVIEGATIIPVPPHIQWLPQSLFHYLQTQSLNRVIIPPNQMAPLLEMCSQSGQQLPLVRHVIFGGEVMPNDLQRLLAPVFPNAQFHHVYGPSEATIFCSCFTLPNCHDASELPLGQALKGTEFSVRDPSTGAVLKAGNTGELCIAGAQLFDGYWMLPDATQAVLFHDVASDMIFYRTGDLVEIGAENDLYFRGRLDSMKKVNGVRIDLNGIEGCLEKHNNVAQAVVVMIRQESRMDALGAAVRLNDGADFDPENLRSFCKTHLSPSHVPRKFLQFSSFPTTATGKMDNKSIQAAFLDRANSATNP